ncbi:MAG TPA: carboxypeptidase-like regulatory domain-containing protein, partial [Thermoanaerobaculia bacterium]|nr:carboxypeptidase-like regulatory domain-containing protein [Thermoanaerobaculia bacterium]
MDAVLLRRRVLAAALFCVTAPLAAGTISGRLLDAGGNPVAGARVSWTAYRDEAELEVDATSGAAEAVLGQVRTGSDGRFDASVLPSGPPVGLRIEPSGLPGVLLAGPFLPDASLELADLELPEPSALAGRVVAQGAVGVAGARVVVRSERPAAFDVVFFAEATAGADGTFTIAASPSGPRRLEVRAAGFAPFLHAVSAGGAAQRIVLEPGGALAGTVTDAAGRPAAAAIVSSSGVAVRTAASGRYRLAGVAAGTRDVEATLGVDQATQRGGLVVRSGAEVAVDLRLAPAASIAGTVTDAASRKPVAGARVSVFEHGASPGAVAMRRATADTSGRFRAGPLLPGRYAVRAEHRGYLATALSGIDARSGAAASAAIALTPAASVAGRVVDEKGKPVAGATVRVGRAGTGLRGWRGAGAAGAARETAAGPDGTFRLEPLARANGETLEATKPGFVPAERALSLATGQAMAGVVLTLRSGLSARGRVTDDQGAALAGAEIRVTQANERGGRRPFRAGPAEGAPDATSAGDGTFVVTGLEEGS